MPPCDRQRFAYYESDGLIYRASGNADRFPRGTRSGHHRDGVIHAGAETNDYAAGGAHRRKAQKRSNPRIRVSTRARSATPSGVYERLRPTITVMQATSGDADAILSFEAQHFPRWLLYYQQVVHQQRYADVVVAKEAKQGIVGTALVLDAHAPGWNNDIRWLSL